MPAYLTCDVCGKETDFQDYDGNVLCELHNCERQLEMDRREYEEKKSWVKKVWLTQLYEMKTNIKYLESRIKKLRGEE